ncbi:MAG: heat-inducible transcription repressor HrcA [Nitrospirae bacterium]|nr:heat-inducible transcription repressor HrcA [Nitrospirota bacterium]MBI3594905.1 heat-inducible transcription repressor HrcA [Nitrospirota bacterium]
MEKEDLNYRDQNILKATIASYIKTASPIGSRTITKQFDFGISPATVRNIMADLEDLGFLAQPHTSAGRIPTEKAYRYYVNYLLDEKTEEFEPYQLTQTEDFSVLLGHTSKMLSLLSRYTSIIMAPKLSNIMFKHIKFISLRKNVILAIFVNHEGNAYNKTFESDETLTQTELDHLATIINERFSNKNLEEIRKLLTRELKEEKKHYEHLLNKVFELNKKNKNDFQDQKLFVEGTTNFMDLPEFMDIEKIKSVFKVFEERLVLVKLLDRFLASEGTQVLIGSENPFLEENECSLVISTYKLSEKEIGAVGVIGPIRMEYPRVIALVDYTAKMLSRTN